MSRQVLCCLVMASLCVQISMTQSAYADPRSLQSLNADWSFRYFGEEPDRLPAFTGSGWQTVTVPHTWNTHDLWDDKPGYNRGIGWYGRQILVPEELKDKKIYVYFEGVNQVAEVSLNGKTLGTHKGGYTGFAVNLSSEIEEERSNYLAVKVDNSHNPDIPPLSADFNFYGGIYRDVYLVAVNDVHFSLDDDGSQGVYAQVGNSTDKRGVVLCKAILVNESDKSETVQFRVSIEGKPAGSDNVVTISQEADAIVVPGTPFELTGELLFANPRLWSPEHPVLYKVRWEILKAGELVDCIETPFAFRTYHADPQKGFFLNGKPYRLIGSNRHQDIKGYGWAVPNELHVRDMEIIKEMGANFVRLAHYPQDPAVLNAADRLGLILWEEIPIVNYVTPSPEFRKNAEQMLTEMIKQHMNHPSIFFWGYMNEVFLKDTTGKYWGDPTKLPKPYVQFVVGLAKDLDTLAHKLDPSRLTVMALVGHDSRNKCGLPDTPDIMGWNIYCGWYVKQPHHFGEFFDEQHKMFPKRIHMVSEYGAGSDPHLHSTQPERFDFTTEWQQDLHESHLQQILDRPWLAGTTLWNHFDFSVESRSDTMEHINQKGICTLDRKPKDIYYHYQARLSDKPVLYIASREWKMRTGLTGQENKQPVKVYSNCDEVELFLDGKSLGKKKTEGKGLATWGVTFVPESKTLIAKATHKGKEFQDETPIYYREFGPDSKVIRINVGSKAQYEDNRKALWLPDCKYTKGLWGYTGGKTSEIMARPNIVKTPSDTLFQSHRIGIEAYKLDVPAGRYKFTLFFAEPRDIEPEQRVFDVTIKTDAQNSTDRVDVAKEVGTHSIYRLNKRVQVSGSEGISVTFTPVKGEPILSAIQLVRVSGPK